jgi:phosphoserine aminotransferase
MELSHRSKEFDEINRSACRRIREIMGIPENYKVLLMQGGGTGQFAAVPMNLLRGENPTADYMVTGTWSAKAYKEAQKYLQAKEVVDKLPSYTSIPDVDKWKLNPEANFVYYCDNETVAGVEFPYVPDVGKVPIACDMSSNFLSRKVDVSKFGVIVAGAQKNVGTAGVTIVIVREDLLGGGAKYCPIILNYAETDKMNSLYNTPCVTAVYVLDQVLQWIQKEGGLEEMERRSQVKSKMIYDLIEQSNGYYYCPVESRFRSRMNAVFLIGGPKGNPELEAAFVKEATDLGLVGLKGHRSVGGLRASLYNAVTLQDTQRLADFMKDFQSRHKV